MKTFLKTGRGLVNHKRGGCHRILYQARQAEKPVVEGIGGQGRRLCENPPGAGEKRLNSRKTADGPRVARADGNEKKELGKTKPSW